LNYRLWIRVSFGRLLLIGVLVGLVLSGPVSQAAAPYAASLTVTYGGVEVLRAGTAVWLPLRTGAVSPFGSGDQLRTDGTGRAYLQLWDGAEILILADSTYRLDELQVTDEVGSRLVAELTGAAVHHMPAVDDALHYDLVVADMQITRPAEWFATWAESDGLQSAAVMTGTLTITDPQPYRLTAQNGIYGLAGGYTTLELAPPLNPARMRGLVEGCPGMVDTTGDVPLRVRSGPGEGYLMLGAYQEDQPVQLMAVNAAGGWYRVQFLSGFGWMLRWAIETNCADLSVMPDDTHESPRFVLDATRAELDLLEPFYGRPVTNPWFYQWSDSS
jgi:hypothetical protein